MLRIPFFLVCLLFSLFVTAQNQQVVDSLKADLLGHRPGDTLRIKTLAKLWRTYKYNDLEKAAAYGRQMIRETTDRPGSKWQASAFLCLASTLEYQGKTDSALTYYRQALTIQEQLGDQKQQGVIAFNIAGAFYYSNSRYDSAALYLNVADTCFTTGDHKRQLAAVNTMRAGVARFQGRHDTALEYALEGLALAERSKDSLAIIDATYEVAMTYEVLGDYPKAIGYFEAIFAFDFRQANYFNAASDLLTLAAYCIDAHQLDSALQYAQRAEVMVEDNKLVALLPNVQYSIGQIYLAREAPKEALPYYLKAEKSGAKHQSSDEYFWTLHQTGATYVQLELAELAKPYLLRALSSAEQRKNLLQLSSTYDQLAIVEGKIGNQGLEVDYLRKAYTLKDSIYQKEAAEKLAELTATFEREKQALLIKQQATQLGLLKSKARAARLQRQGLIGGMLALLALLAAGWYSYRQRHQRQELEKARLADELITHQKELSAHALQMAQKGQLLDQLGEELRQIKGERPDDRKKLDGMLRELSSEERIDQDWANFRTYFQGVHGDFEDRLKTVAEAKLSPRELRLAALIKMQLSNQEVGAILGVTQESLYKAKYRLRKKLPGASEGELDAFLAAF